MSNFVDTTTENVKFVIKRNGEKVTFDSDKMDVLFHLSFVLIVFSFNKP